MAFAAVVWHYWLGVLMFFGAIGTILLVLVLYVIKVQAPKYPKHK
ncbi:MAG: hypothetical protein ACT4PW_04710 [Acidimicrobiia bacterium]